MRTKSAEARKETEADPRWAAVVARDGRADGHFVYAVKTTGVYCRPGCQSRLALPENVAFFDRPSDAAAAGYRPCLRCKPDAAQAEPHTALIAELCRYIESAEEAPTLDALAERAEMSPYHLHRIFKRMTGLTPKAYATAHRAERVRDALQNGGTVTEAMYDAGYGSSSRFYAASDAELGMKPKSYQAGGPESTIRFAVGACSLGAILVAQSGTGVCAILLGDDPDTLIRELEQRFPKADLQPGDAAFDGLVSRVVGFVEAPKEGLDLPLDIRGTAFQRRVWLALRDIPSGETVSYGEIAERIGAPKSVRAVAGACAANALAVAIPCHRVVRTDGGLSGYRWGVERKQVLLDRERGE